MPLKSVLSAITNQFGQVPYEIIIIIIIIIITSYPIIVISLTG